MPERITSGVVELPTVSVPKVEPEIFVPVPVLPTVKPRSSGALPAPVGSGTAVTLAAVMVTPEGVPLVAGSASLAVGTVSPAMLASVSEAPCPTSFSLASSA